MIKKHEPQRAGEYLIFPCLKKIKKEYGLEDKYTLTDKEMVINMPLDKKRLIH